MKKKYTYNAPTEFSEDQIKLLKPKVIAEKYDCTPEYVVLILRGKRLANTDTAKGIIEDAKRIIEVIETI